MGMRFTLNAATNQYFYQHLGYLEKAAGASVRKGGWRILSITQSDKSLRECLCQLYGAELIWHSCAHMPNAAYCRRKEQQ
jgi:hypothetical protein